MIVVDSSMWLEFFAGTKYGSIIKENKDFKDSNYLLPSIIVFEVYKKLLQSTDAITAMIYITQMRMGAVSILDYSSAVFAAEISIKHKLPLADSIIYSSTISNNATLFTMDKHFEKLPNVKYFKK